MKRLAKRTYSLPTDLMKQFEERVGPGDRSPFLARLLAEWLELQEREELRRRVIEGCHAMADLYSEVDREWTPVSDETWP
jgi:hypothetical protein